MYRAMVYRERMAVEVMVATAVERNGTHVTLLS